MKKFIPKSGVFAIVLLIANLFFVNISLAQTNPVAQTLPYTQDFSTLTGSTTTYPAGWQGWNFGATALGGTFNTVAPTANDALAGQNNAQTSAHVGDYTGKMGLLSTSTAIRTICLAINTTAQTNIVVTFTARTQRYNTNDRIGELGLQYRVGTSGNFTNITGSTYQNTTTVNTTGTTGINPSTITITLPAACENVANLQLRWIQRDVSGINNRPGFSIDDIYIATSTAIFNSANPTGTFTVPAGVSSILIQAWGGGGGGASNGGNGSGGGGGGAYASKTISVVAGATYSVSVGSGGNAGSAGGVSFFNLNNLGDVNSVVAAGGSSSTSGSGGTGGATGGSNGTNKKAGGNGGSSSAGNNDAGGGGGSSASSNANGIAGGSTTNTSGGAGGDGPDGDGGRGCDNGTDNTAAGTAPGGGGGGRSDDLGTSQPGASGQVLITWGCAATNVSNFTTTASTPVCIGSGSTVTGTSSTLIPSTNYQVYYSLTGTNVTATPQLATLTYVSGTNWNFTTATLANAGATIVTINTVGCAFLNGNNTANITVNSLITNNTISGSSICQGGNISLTGSVPTGGNGTYTYLWESSTTSAIAGFATATGTSNGQNYSSGTITQTTWYRRTVTSAPCAANTSAAIQINVTPAIANNTVTSTQTQPICTGSAPAAITGTLPTGGTGTYTYLWESSTTSATAGFATASGTSNGQNYTSGALTQTTWFRRTVTSGACSDVSTAFQIIVNNNIGNNTVATAQSICTGATPAGLTGTTPTGGNGTYTYLWESSTTSATTGFATASGTSNGINYAPGALTQTTWYRRIVSSGPCADNTSTAIQITVNPVIANNTVSSATPTICTASTATIAGTLPTGGSGTYTYLWESSTTSATAGFATAAGTSNGQNYTSAALTQTTWFRRTVNSGGCIDVSAAFQITVNNNIANNTIAAAQTICTGTTPAGLTGSTPTGGNGTYTYLWESSTTSATTGFGTASGTSNDINYAPGSLTQTTWYRRTIISGPCANNVSTAIQITVNNNIANNTIATAQSICAGATPAPLTGATPTGGNGTYTYLWESSITSATTGFGTASGTSNSINYTPGALTQTTWYRRTVTSAPCAANTSAAIQINVTPAIASNTITSAQTQPICTGSTPAAITGTLPVGGTGTYTYLWESSTTSATTGFATATGTSNGQDYTPGALTQTTWFRRTVTSGACTDISTAFQITVNSNIANNTIAASQTICTGATPAGLTGTVPTGGNGTYIYLWVSSTTSANAGFVAASGTNNGINYAPGALTQTTWYRRVASSGPCADNNSAAVQITVNPVIANNTVSSAITTVCTGSTASITGTLPTGGGGTYTYNWESSITSATTGFGNAAGTRTNQSYTSAALSQTTWFRRTVTSGGCTDVSTAIQITVNNNIANNTIASALTICSGTTPAGLTGATPTGGNGIYTYLWESSIASATTGFATASGTSNGINYAPGALTQTTWFRRTVISGPCANSVSAAIQITVNPVPVTTGVTVCQGGSGSLSSSTTCPIIGPITIGPNNAAAGANVTGIGNTGWSALGNIISDNNSYATVVLSDATKISNYLQGTQYSFAIPNGATIDGIQVTIGKFASNFIGNTRMRDNEVKLVKSGTIVGLNRANLGVDWPQSEAPSNYGSASDLWGTTWSASDINNLNFGVVLSTLNATGSGISYTASVDYMEITVTYTINGTLNWYTAASGGTAFGSGSPFNPVGVLNSGLPNTNTSGTTTFYAECSTVPGCRTGTDFIINPAATVSAGSNQTICAGSTATMAGSFGGAASSAIWSTSGTGTFSNNTPTAVYTPSAADITAGSRTLTYTTNDPAGPCGAVNASIILTINPAATVSAGSNQTICAGSTATMAGSFGGGATSATWSTSGTGTFNNNNINAVYTPGAGDISAGSVTLTYTTNDPVGPCGSVNASMILTINPAATVSAGSNQTICAGSTATMAGSFGGGATSATWSTSGTGTFSNNTPTAVYTPSAADITAGSRTLTYTTNDPVGPCGAVNASMILTINPAATVSAGSNKTICAGSTATMTGSFGGGASSAMWSTSGDGMFNNNNTNAIYTPGAGDISVGSVTLTYTTNDPDGAGPCVAANASITLTISAAATVSAGSNKTICSGSTATMAGSFGGAASSAMWSTSGTGTFSDNSTTAVYTPSGADITAGSVTLTYTTDDPAGPCAAASASITLTINSNTWLGTSTTWNDPNNWSCGIVPNSPVSDIVIPAGTTFSPLINADYSIRDITIDVNASLAVDVASGSILRIYGNTANSGTLTNNGLIVLTGSSSTQTFPGPGGTISAMSNLEVNKTTGTTVLIDKSFTLSGVLTPTLGTIDLGNNFITLKSDVNNTARVGVVGGGFNYNNGRFIVQRYFNSTRSWRLMTAPVTESNTIFDGWQLGGLNTTTTPAIAGQGEYVTGPGATGATGNGLDAGVSGNYSLKTYNSSTGALVGVGNTKVAVSPGFTGSTASNIGYFNFVRGDRTPSNIDPNTTNTNITTLSSTGKLQTGPYTFPAVPVKDKYTLIGNPYASPIYFPDITLNNVQRRFYAWDPQINQVGAYVVVDDPFNTGTWSYSVDPSLTSQRLDIQSSQAIFVQTINDGTASLTFNETNKSANDVGLLFRPSQPSATITSFRTNLFLLNADNSTAVADGVFAQFSTDFSNAVDVKDGIKFPNVNETFSILRDGTLLSLERRQPITITDTLFLNLTRSSQRGYQFQFKADGLYQAGVTAFLEDSYLITSTPIDLSATATANFTINADALSAAANRFRIVFKASAGGPVPLTFTSLKAWQQSNAVNVEWRVDNEMNMKEYQVEKSTDGLHFSNAAAIKATGNNNSTANYQWPDANPVAGNNYYRISSVDVNGKIQYSNVVKVFVGKGKSRFVIYPNPITNGNINLQLINQPKGAYALRLMNKLGQLIMEKQIEHEEGSSSETLQINSTLAHGTYQLEITKPGNTKTNLNVLY